MNETRITAKGIMEDADKLINQVCKSQFPVEIFPTMIRKIIWKMKEALTYPVDYTASSMLVAIAVGIGNTHVLKFKSEWTVKDILYMALVGRPGANKSHPLRTVLRPYFEFDSEQYRKFSEELNRYNKIMGIKKKERMEQGYETDPTLPVRKRFLVSDITQEAMVKALAENRRGICLYMDELQGWVKNFTRYNNGSEEQFYISLFNGSCYISDRKGDTNNNCIDDPFACIIGTIQPAILTEMLKGSKSDNGFAERILFAIPEEQEKSYWNDTDMDASYYGDWDNIIQKLIHLKISTDETGRVIPTTIEYEPEAKKLLLEWQRNWTDMINEEESDKKKGIYSKFEIFIHRFCIIIQVCKWLCNEGSTDKVDFDTVTKAIKLVDYYKGTALLVNDMMNGIFLTAKQKELLQKLPEEFSRSEGLEIAIQLEWNPSTFDRFLKKASTKYLIHRHGHYKKAIDKMPN